VVVDEAQEMSTSMLTELRFLVNHQMDSCSLFPLILVGQPELRRLLRLNKHEAIAQRISLQYHLGGLSAEETKTYIKHQMQTTGMNTPVFSESALSRIHAASQGIPRVINHFCSQALHDAERRGHEVIEETHIGARRALLDK
jgi:type II secretory pathway predicted ATPase ExeA